MLPDQTEIEEIADTLSVPGERRRAFVFETLDLAETLEYAREAINDPQKERREMVRSLEAVLFALQKAKRAAKGRAGYFNLALSTEFSAAIGTIVSQPGVRRHLSDEQFVSTYDHRADFAPEVFGQPVVYNPGKDSSEDVQVTFADFTGNALVSLLDMQCRLLGQEIDGWKKNSGGRPRNRIREFLLLELLALHESTFLSDATASPGGTFNQMCEQLFLSFGEPTEGLETAIKRFLHRSS